jgi:hypothetical protein
MNKSILLVVCDFLVLSLLSFISFEATAEEGASISQAALEEAKNQSQSEVGLLFEILNKKNEEQQKENEEQSTKLGAEKDALEKALADRKKNLDQRIAELEKTRKDLENTEELATNLAEEKARLQKERTGLQKEKSKLKEERDILTGQTKEAADTRSVLLTEVKDLESKKAVVGERLKNMQNEVEKKKAELSQQQKELALVGAQKNAVVEEKQTLQVALARKDATLTSTKDVLAKTEGTLASAQQNIQTLQGDKVELQGTLAQSEAQKSFIAKQKMALEKKTQQLLDSKGQLEEEKTGLQDENRDLLTSLEKSRLQIEANKKEEERIRQSIVAAKADLERQRKEASAELARQEADKARLLAEKEKIMDNNRKLTENVATLAELSGKKTDEIKNKIDAAQPLSPNTIFTLFRNAQVRLRFLSLTKGILGATQTREFNIPATLVEDSRGVFAVTLIKNSPFEIRRARSATGISGTLFVGSKTLPVLDVSYAPDDPRVLIVPLPPKAADGLHRFKIDSDPYHFPKAILVDPDGKGYGEMAFNIHAENDQYIELKSGLLRSLSGEFTQSTGDFTFSQTGHFLGILVNRNHAIRLPDLSSPYKMPLGDAFNPERASLLSSILERKVRILNAELH